MMENGKEIHADDSCEVIGIVHIPGYPEENETIGYYIRDKKTEITSGFSKPEAWQIIFDWGATNARAVVNPNGNKVIEGTNSISEVSKNIPVWNEAGDLYAPLSEETVKIVEEALIFTSRKKADEMTTHLSFETDFDNQDLYAVKEAVEQADKIVVLTGAGVSTMSGIPDYRTVAMGMWQKNPKLLEQLNEDTFRQDPAAFWEAFYRLLHNTLRPLMVFDNHTSLLAVMKAISPNETHQLFSWLEGHKSKKVTVITQNVDRLHQNAGSSKVIEFHGNVLEASCRQCGRTYPLAEVLKKEEKPECPHCGGNLRPDAVFFGDPVKGLEESVAAVEACDLVLVAGTSLQVYPFSSLINYVSADKKLIYLNGELPEEPALFDYTLSGNLSAISRKLKDLLQS